MTKKVEKKFTMEQAVEQIKQKEEAKAERLAEFQKLISEAMEKTNCRLQIDLNSPLGNLLIIPIAND